MDSETFAPGMEPTREEVMEAAPGTACAGFEQFWREKFEMILEHRPYWYIQREIWSPDASTRIYLLRAKTWDNREIGMWIARPDVSRGGVVFGHECANIMESESIPGFTVCTPCVRGLGLSQCLDIPWKPESFILHGIRSRDSYIRLGAVSDLACAASVMCEMFPDTASNLNFTGSEFGAANGIFLLAFDKRFKSGCLALPSFGNLYCLLNCASGDPVLKSLRTHVSEHPESVEELSFFDASVAAGHIRVPVIIMPALYDPLTPPPVQFGIANAVTYTYKNQFVLDCGHSAPSERDIEVMKEVNELKIHFFEAPK